MKRWITGLSAGAYVAALVFGFLVHALKLEVGCHALMYFLTFNMFGGWSAYEARMEIVGEGASGAFYKLEPGPWGEFHPYGSMGRRHYDQEFEYGKYFVRNCLKHTIHEPIIRVFVVEVDYPKKLNLPDDQYAAYYEKPKDWRRYCHTRFVMTPEGEILSQQPVWLRYQDQAALEDNPRLVADAVHNRPFCLSAGTMAPGSDRTVPSPPRPALSIRRERPLAE